jgi:hypothetical protein
MGKILQMEILAKNNSQPGNIQLVNYLRKNLTTLVKKANIRFKFTIIEKSDEKNIVKKGITNVPACISNNNVYSGAGEIIEYLSELVTKMDERQSINKKQQGGAQQRLSSPEDEINDYFSKEMTMEAKKRDDQEDTGSPEKAMEKAKSQAMHDMESRNKRYSSTDSGKRSDNIRSSSSFEKNASNDKSYMYESNRDIVAAIKSTQDPDQQLFLSVFEETT